MSSTWLNFRFFYWHLQCGEPKWYSVEISYNKFHKENKLPDGWFSLYR